MKNLAIALCLAITFAVPLFGQDPCTQTTKLSATAQGVQTWNGTKGATTVGGSGDDAYGVEAWTEAGGNATKLTWFGPNQGGGYAFRAEWTNSTDYLGRFGYYWGSSGKKWNNLGDLCVAYNYTRSANGTGGSYSYLGIYGWTIGSSNSAEYYIVEDWFGNGQQGASNLGNNCQTHGNITVDGKTYQVVTCIRPQGSGCVSCNNQAFGQVFSIRQNMASASKCGTISIKKHFEEWTKMTTEKGGQSPAKYIYDKTYESKFLAEAAGGTGWFEASYMKFSRTGACGSGSTTTSSSSGGGTTPSSSSAMAASPTCNDYQASFCGGSMAWASVSGNSTTIPTTGQCLYIGNFETIQPALNSTVAINGVENACGGEWANCPLNDKPAAKDGGYYVYVKTGTINSYENNGWQGIVAKPKPSCTAPPSPSSSSAVPSSSSKASSSSAAPSSSSSPSSSSVAPSSSSRPSSSSSAAVSSSSSSPSSSSVAVSSSSAVLPTPILANRIPVTYFSIQTLSDKALRIEISSPSVVEIFDLKGNKAEKFDVSGTLQTVKLSSPSGVYFAKVHGMKSIKFVLK